MSNFEDDIERGKVGENIFESDFLLFLGIKYQNVTGIQKFQTKDVDHDTDIGTYEIKTNYNHKNKELIIEEYTNINESLAKLSKGWFYKSEANMLVCVDKHTRIMVLVPFTDVFKSYYESIKDNYDLIRNRVSHHNGNKWQSAFRKIPLSALSGDYSFYKKM